MKSSSKRRASSSKKSSAGKAQVISVGRKDALPRTGNVSAGRRKPALPPPVDAPKEPLATAPARSTKKARQTETSANRAKTPRTAGRASGKLKKPGATEVMPAPGMVEVATPAPGAEERPADMVDAPALITEAVEPMAAAAAPDSGALASVETEVEVEASAIMEETTIADGSAVAPAAHQGRRALVAAASRLLSTLVRWTGVRR
jgi:hypothetical protein